MNAQQKSCRWVLTINNPGTERPTWEPSSMNYLVWEIERGELGTIHVQGYVRFKTRKLLSQVSLLFPRAHLEAARGTEEANRTYCTKDRQLAGDDWGEFGEYDAQAGRQGRRTDLEAAFKTLREGGIRAVAQNHPEIILKYPGGIQRVAELLEEKPPIIRTMTTTVLWGEPGTGKTWRTMLHYPDAYSVTPGRGPWDNYEGEEVVVFDEFDYNKWPVEEMNQLCDIYRLRLNCRYHNRWARWTKVVIISNLSPDVWWQYHEEAKRRAFQRRITRTIEVLNREQEILFD